MRYKITKSYTVEANSRREARYKLNSLQNSGEADEWLEFESVREIKSSEKDGTGWLNGFKISSSAAAQMISSLCACCSLPLGAGEP